DPVQQNKQPGFATAGLTDQSDPLAGVKTKAESVEHLEPAGIAERDVVEDDGGAALYQRFGFRMVLQFMREQQGGDSFGQPGDMLGNIDQRHREIARGIQDGKSQGAD